MKDFLKFVDESEINKGDKLLVKGIYLAWLSEDEEETTEKHRYFNHHHEITNKHEFVDFGDGEFIANKNAIPLLKALNEIGLKTRTHHIGDEEDAFLSILLDDVDIEIKTVNEIDADRNIYNGKKELLIMWRKSF